jgi:hypothetical protein
VFQYGSESSGYAPVLSLFTSKQSLFTLPSRYFFAIGLPPVFSLRRFYRRFALHYQAALLYTHIISLVYVPGLSPAAALHSSRSTPPKISSSQRPRAYHQGSSVVARRYSRNPRLFLLLSLLICLSPERLRTHRALFEQRPPSTASRILSRSSSPGEPIDPVQGIIHHLQV